MQGGAFVDLAARDVCQIGYRRIGGECRFLFGDGQCRTKILIAGFDFERGEGRLDIGRPAFTITGLRRQKPHNPRSHIGRAEFRLPDLGRRRATCGQRDKTEADHVFQVLSHCR